MLRDSGSYFGKVLEIQHYVTEPGTGPGSNIVNLKVKKHIKN